MARREINAVHALGKLPILVGGTGLYFNSLIKGIAPVPPIDWEVRREVRAAGVEANRTRLIEHDPDAAARLHPADTLRTARALEVVLSTGKTLAEWQDRREGGIGAEISLRPLILLPPRDWLYERCDQRFSTMIENGAIDEVKALLQRSLDLPCRPCAHRRARDRGFVDGEIDREEAIPAQQVTATMPHANIPGSRISRRPKGPLHRPSKEPASSGVELLARTPSPAPWISCARPNRPLPLAAKRWQSSASATRPGAGVNLHDSGIDIVVGLRGGSSSATEAEAHGLQTALVEKAVASADVIMLLAPDEILAALYSEIEPHIRGGAALGFSHGLAIHFGPIEPRDDLDVFMVAPKGPGSALRTLFQDGKGMIGLWAIAQDRSGAARELALAYGRAVGCAREGLIASSFAEECEADLFNEGAVVWGAVPEILVAGFDTLVAGGISEEVAFLECVGELKLISELIEERGIAGMREAISNTPSSARLWRQEDRRCGVAADERAFAKSGGRFAEELKREEAKAIRG